MTAAREGITQAFNCGHILALSWTNHPPMGSYIDVAGASGASYRFTVAENAKPVTPVAGVFVYVRQPPDEPAALLFIGQADSLAADAPAHWAEAVERYGATHLYVRLNVARSARQADMADLLAAYAPPMNI